MGVGPDEVRPHEHVGSEVRVPGVDQPDVGGVEGGDGEGGGVIAASKRRDRFAAGAE